MLTHAYRHHATLALWIVRSCTFTCLSFRCSAVQRLRCVLCASYQLSYWIWTFHALGFGLPPAIATLAVRSASHHVSAMVRDTTGSPYTFSLPYAALAAATLPYARVLRLSRYRSPPHHHRSATGPCVIRLPRAPFSARSPLAAGTAMGFSSTHVTSSLYLPTGFSAPPGLPALPPPITRSRLFACATAWNASPFQALLL